MELNPQVEFMYLDERINNDSKKYSTIFNDAKTPLNCLNCYSNKYGYCISITQIEDKTNEIPTVEEVVKNLTGIILTCDALNSQTKKYKCSY